MNFSTPLPNWRFAIFSISLLLSACVSQPVEKGIEPDIVTDSKPSSHTMYASSSTVTPSPYGSQILSSYTGSYALLIGESKYTHGWSRLESIPDELQEVEKVLQAQGFQVEKSLNLTARELKNRFETFINQHGFKENNRLLFFYSGHGHTLRKRGYLVPTDAPNPHFEEEGFLQKAVTMNEILAMARKMYAKHALFLFDSCFSGTVFQAKDLPEMPRQISEMAELPVRQFITAGSAEQRVPAKSVFTPAFVDALRYGLGDLYKDGYVTGEELGLYLKNKVPQHTDQTPQYGKIRDYELSRGDFVFVVGSANQVVAQSPTPVPVAPVPTAPIPKPKLDSDRDGITDEQDKCPRNTAAEIAKGVYKKGSRQGCPIDSDNDRIADYQDSCPYNQPKELVQGVHSNGCPTDKDRDGVADYLDRCPHNQSREISQGVDPWGCPLDSDMDGVADYQDACPETPLGVKVKQNGCFVPVSVASTHSPTHSSYRYTDNGDGTVTDNRSGLIWLKNANCFDVQDWETAMQSAANLAHGQCGLRDGSRAGMWRLPTKEEWKAMIDEKYVEKQNWEPAISNAAGTGPWKEGDAFSGVQTYNYWSSTENASSSDSAWNVHLNNGYVSTFHKADTNYVWPVRGR